MSKDNLENIFRSAETEKRVPLSTGAWNRLDDMLQEDKRKSVFSRFSIIGIAASLAVLLTAVVVMQDQSNRDYKLEMLVIDKSEILYSSSAVAQLNTEHQNQTLQKLKPFYNMDGKVQVKGKQLIQNTL